MLKQKTTLPQVLEFIRQADDCQVSEIIHTLVARYKEVYPDWEVVFLSLPKNNPTERKNMIQRALYFLDKDNM